MWLLESASFACGKWHVLRLMTRLIKRAGWIASRHFSCKSHLEVASATDLRNVARQNNNSFNWKDVILLAPKVHCVNLLEEENEDATFKRMGTWFTDISWFPANLLDDKLASVQHVHAASGLWLGHHRIFSHLTICKSDRVKACLQLRIWIRQCWIAFNQIYLVMFTSKTIKYCHEFKVCCLVRASQLWACQVSYKCSGP